MDVDMHQQCSYHSNLLLLLSPPPHTRYSLIHALPQSQTGTLKPCRFQHVVWQPSCKASCAGHSNPPIDTHGCNRPPIDNCCTERISFPSFPFSNSSDSHKPGIPYDVVHNVSANRRTNPAQVPQHRTELRHATLGKDWQRLDSHWEK